MTAILIYGDIKKSRYVGAATTQPFMKRTEGNNDKFM